MTQLLRPSRKPAADGYILGRRAFAKISAIEGLRLSEAQRKDFEEFDRHGLSPEERRRAIARKFATAR